MFFIFIFIFGLSVGSFINVLIDRLPFGQSVIKERSHCDHCKKILPWFDLIPVFSFILLKGSCRFCRQKISWQYPLVEITTSLLFLFTYFYWWKTAKVLDYRKLFIYFFIISGLLTVFITDLKYRIIPDEMTVLLIIVTFIYLLFYFPSDILANLLTGLFVFSFFLFLLFITKGRGMGMGDVKFSFFLGLLLGFPKAVVSLYLAFLTGALLSLILIVSGKKKMKSTIAFGPFLVVGTLISFFFGNNLWQLYLKHLGL